MKISKTALLISGGVFTVLSLGLMVVDAKTLSKDLSNAIQHIQGLYVVQTGGSNNNFPKSFIKKGSDLVLIETYGNNFVLSKEDSFRNEATKSSKSSILGGVNNRINSGTASVILGGDGNKINESSLSTILGGKHNNLKGNYSTILGGSGNKIIGTNSVVVGGSSNTISGNYSVTVGNSNQVTKSYSAALGSGSKVNADKSFLWTDENHNGGELLANNVFAIVSDSGMVINEDEPHRFAQLTIGGPMRVYDGGNHDQISCGDGKGGGIMKVVNNDDAGAVCLCSCNGSGRTSLFGKGNCNYICDFNAKPKCGDNLVKICSSTTGFVYSGSCEKGEVLGGTGAYYVDKDDVVHWTCQTDGGDTKQCTGYVKNYVTPASCKESYRCVGPVPENGIQINENISPDVGKNVPNTLYDTVAEANGHGCSYVCPDGFYKEGNDCIKKEVYRLKYDDNGCGEAPGEEELNYDDEVRAEGMLSLKDEKQFLKWCSDKNGKEPCYRVDWIVKPKNENPTSNIELYAKCDNNPNLYACKGNKPEQNGGYIFAEKAPKNSGEEKDWRYAPSKNKNNLDPCEYICDTDNGRERNETNKKCEMLNICEGEPKPEREGYIFGPKHYSSGYTLTEWKYAGDKTEAQLVACEYICDTAHNRKRNDTNKKCEKERPITYLRCGGSPIPPETGYVFGKDMYQFDFVTRKSWTYTGTKDITLLKECEYTCDWNNGFEWVEDRGCIKEEPSEYECGGDEPSGPGVKTGSSVYYTLSHTPKEWKYTGSITLKACQWTCKYPFVWDGATGCVKEVESTCVESLYECSEGNDPTWTGKSQDGSEILWKCEDEQEVLCSICNEDEGYERDNKIKKCVRCTNTLTVDPKGGKVDFDGGIQTKSHTVTGKCDSGIEVPDPVWDPEGGSTVYRVNYDTDGGSSVDPTSVTRTTTTTNTFISWDKAGSNCDGLNNKYYKFQNVDKAYCILTANWQPKTESDTPSITLAGAPSRTDCIFTGWKTDGDDKLYKAGESYTPKKTETTMKAQWECSSSCETTLVVDPVGTDGYISGTVYSVKFGEDLLYDDIIGNTDISITKKCGDETVVNVSRVTTGVKECKVIFSGNGGQILTGGAWVWHNVTGEYRDWWTATGEFTGWYMWGYNGIDQWSDMLCGFWSTDLHTYTHHSDILKCKVGAKWEDGETVTTEMEEVKLPGAKKEEWIFDGWYPNYQGASRVGWSGDSIAPEFCGSHGYNGEYVLVAHWVKDDCMSYLVVDPNGGEVTADNVKVQGKPKIIKEKCLTSVILTGNKEDSKKTVVDGYVVTFDIKRSDPVINGENFSVTQTGTVTTGYTLTGWENKECDYINFSTIKRVGIIDGFILYGYTFSGRDYTCNIKAKWGETRKEDRNNVKLPEAKTHEYCRFRKWNDGKESYDPGTDYMPDGPTNMKAVWACCTGTIPGANALTGIKRPETDEAFIADKGWTYKGEMSEEDAANNLGSCEWACPKGFVKNGDSCIPETLKCGVATGKYYTLENRPNNDKNDKELCETGTPTEVEQNGDKYEWKCKNVYDQETPCSANIIACGTSKNGKFDKVDDIKYPCNQNSKAENGPKELESGQFTWNCYSGSEPQKVTVSCSATKAECSSMLTVDPNGGKIFAGGKQIEGEPGTISENCGEIIDLTGSKEKDVKTINGCLVKFDLNGGTADTNPEMFNSRQQINTGTTTYDLSGWNGNDICLPKLEGGVYKYTFGDRTTCEIHAQWKLETSTDYGKIKLPGTPRKDYCRFRGWKDYNGGIHGAGTDYLPPQEESIVMTGAWACCSGGELPVKDAVISDKVPSGDYDIEWKYAENATSLEACQWKCPLDYKLVNGECVSDTLEGECGDAAGKNYTSEPVYDLCKVGDPSKVYVASDNPDEYEWKCNSEVCRANIIACGASNGGKFGDKDEIKEPCNSKTILNGGIDAGTGDELGFSWSCISEDYRNTVYCSGAISCSNTLYLKTDFESTSLKDGGDEWTGYIRTYHQTYWSGDYIFPYGIIPWVRTTNETEVGQKCGDITAITTGLLYNVDFVSGYKVNYEPNQINYLKNKTVQSTTLDEQIQLSADVAVYGIKGWKTDSSWVSDPFYTDQGIIEDCGEMGWNLSFEQTFYNNWYARSSDNWIYIHPNSDHTRCQKNVQWGHKEDYHTGSFITIPPYNLVDTENYCQFIGWKEKDGENGDVRYFSGDEFTPTKDTTMVADWACCRGDKPIKNEGTRFLSLTEFGEHQGNYIRSETSLQRGDDDLTADKDWKFIDRYDVSNNGSYGEWTYYWNQDPSVACLWYCYDGYSRVVGENYCAKKPECGSASGTFVNDTMFEANKNNNEYLCKEGGVLSGEITKDSIEGKITWECVRQDGTGLQNPTICEANYVACGRCVEDIGACGQWLGTLRSNGESTYDGQYAVDGYGCSNTSELGAKVNKVGTDKLERTCKGKTRRGSNVYQECSVNVGDNNSYFYK